MTCIVGIVHDGKVHLGTDSQATTDSRTHAVGAKMFSNGPATVAFCGSGRDAQLLQYKTDFNGLKSDDILRELSTGFVDALIEARKASGSEAKFADGTMSTSSALIGVQGRLFEMHSDFSFIEVHECTAMGSGAQYALGSLHTSAGVWKSPRRRLRAALEAACANDAYCGGELHYMSR